MHPSLNDMKDTININLLFSVAGIGHEDALPGTGREDGGEGMQTIRGLTATSPEDMVCSLAAMSGSSPQLKGACSRTVVLVQIWQVVMPSAQAPSSGAARSGAQFPGMVSLPKWRTQAISKRVALPL